MCAILEANVIKTIVLNKKDLKNNWKKYGADYIPQSTY